MRIPTTLDPIWLLPAYFYFMSYFIFGRGENPVTGQEFLIALIRSVRDRATRNKLKVIKTIRKKFRLSDEIEIEINENLELAFIKSVQKKLKLAVIGEFSSGKSTLINALLGEEVLKASPLPTTSVSNSVVFSKKKFFEVKDRAGNTIVRKEITNLDESFAEMVKVHTAFGEAKGQKVTLGWNSPFLKDNIDIIDTPGANSDSEAHRLEAIKTIKQDADFVVVLIKATQPLTMSLVEFLKGFDFNYNIKVAFVVTHIDHVPKKEMDDVMATIKNRIEDEFGIINPLIYPVSSIGELDYLSSRQPDSNLKAYHEGFIKFSESLKENLKQGRKKILSSSIDTVLTSLKNIITGELNTKVSTLEENRKNFKDILIPNREESRADINDKYVNHIQMLQNKAISQTQSLLQETFNGLNSTVLANINGSSSGSSLKTLLENLGPTVNWALKPVLTKLKTVTDPIFDFTAISKECEASFWNEFNKVQTFSNKFMFKKINSEINLSLPRFDDFKAPEPISSSNNAAASLGGAAAGAVLGTMIFPGVGTVIGGFLGALFGASDGPPIHELRIQAWSSARNQLLHMQNSITFQYTNNIVCHCNLMISHSHKRVHGLFQQYYAEVKKVNRHYEAQRKIIDAEKAVVLKHVNLIEKAYLPELKPHQRIHEKKAA